MTKSGNILFIYWGFTPLSIIFRNPLTTRPQRIPQLKVENIVAKGEIARFEQFLLSLLCFQKAVCCRGVRKCLYEGKG